MFLFLKFPGGDKHISLFASNLAGDEGFKPYASCGNAGSDRARFDRLVDSCNLELGTNRRGAIGMLFNQFRWEDTSGWEYWTDQYQMVLKHALLVAAALKQPLHLHSNAADTMIAAALSCGIKFDFEQAQPLANPLHKDFRWTNDELARGQFFLLTQVALPAAITSA